MLFYTHFHCSTYSYVLVHILALYLHSFTLFYTFYTILRSFNPVFTLTFPSTLFYELVHRFALLYSILHCFTVFYILLNSFTLICILLHSFTRFCTHLHIFTLFCTLLRSFTYFYALLGYMILPSSLFHAFYVFLHF